MHPPRLDLAAHPEPLARRREQTEIGWVLSQVDTQCAVAAMMQPGHHHPTRIGWRGLSLLTRL
jgi:hypothetical protein